VYLPSALDERGGAAAAAPLALEAPAPQPEPAPKSLVGTGLAGMKALIVDDDIRNIFALTTLLERAQLEVISAESGDEGVAMLERTADIDVAIVDIMMPVTDGYATIRAMRQLAAGRDLPIVALTANVAAGTRQRCIDAGASAYVSKPVEATDLLLILGEWLPGAEPVGRAPGEAG
jgi:CheY-like chemotaxis protein